MTENLVGTTGDLEARCGWKCIQCTHGAAIAFVSYQGSHLNSGQELIGVLEAKLPSCHMPDVEETRAHAESCYHVLVAVSQTEATMLEDEMDWQWSTSDDDPMNIDSENVPKTDEGYEESTTVQKRSAPEHMMQTVAVLRL
ncbi:hypothetical protein LZ30DRAFT_744068 [Colletotrichum cereale]|nr:hypothetical protein LZ30DRAFT_744068 [Colletotrichum cereale]